MRRILSVFSLAFIIPLAACFDVEMAVNFPDENTAEGTMTMTATPEFYAMTTAGEDPFCEGEDTALEDGSHTCVESFSGTIDEILADPDMGEGMTIERRGDEMFVSFDLGDLTEDVAPPEEEGEDAAQMKEMMRGAFMGHSINIVVSGSEIVETNGTVSDDGTTASFAIPLETLLDDEPNLPSSFDVLLKPGS